jgi:hypothetical protein
VSGSAGTLKRTSVVRRTVQRRSLPDRIDAEHSVIGRWRVFCDVLFRYRQYGWWFVWFFAGPIQYLLAEAANRIDLLFHPELRTMKLDRPVFVFGHPRSGTTFLQKSLYETGQVSMFRTWELWFPTLTERFIAGAVI